MIKLVELKKEYTLRGIYNEVENSKGIVVMFHGFTGHLNENGCRYILCGLNPNSRDTFWVFERTEKLNKLVKQWFDHKD